VNPPANPDGTEPAPGCFCALGSPLAVELLARSGEFGWLCLDLQHGMGGFDAALAALQATSGTGTMTLVRVPPDEPALVSRVLDAGADGVLVANVDSREQARLACRAAFYPPVGARSIGATRARFLRPDYVSAAAAHTRCMVMLESPLGFAELDAILDEPVTGVFVGLADLMLALGRLGAEPLADPQVRAWLERTVRECRERGLSSGVFAEHPRTAAGLRAMGFDLVGIGLDVSLLLAGARHQRAAYQDACRAPAPPAGAAPRPADGMPR
jgi:4-hydroxy-2-oxoheptanedioate aldolase